MPRLLYGDGAAADRLLDALLAASPNDAELMYIQGHALPRRRQAATTAPADAMRTAPHWFTRAHRADGNHYQTLYRYAESLRGEREYLSREYQQRPAARPPARAAGSAITMNAAPMLIEPRRIRRRPRRCSRRSPPIRTIPASPAPPRNCSRRRAPRRQSGRTRATHPRPPPPRRRQCPPSSPRAEPLGGSARPTIEDSTWPNPDPCPSTGPTRSRSTRSFPTRNGWCATPRRASRRRSCCRA